MSSARERVQQEAESYAARKARGAVYVGGVPNEGITTMRRIEARNAFIAGRTVSAEMIEQAAEAINEELVDRVNNDELFIETDGPDPAELERALARAAFTAAGFIVDH